MILQKFWKNNGFITFCYDLYNLSKLTAHLQCIHMCVCVYLRFLQMKLPMDGPLNYNVEGLFG